MSRDDVVIAGPLGRVEVTSAAVAGLVVRAAESVRGVRVRRPRRGLGVELVGKDAHVQIGVVGPLDGVLPDVGEQVQRAVADAMRQSLGLDAAVDLAFEELE